MAKMTKLEMQIEAAQKRIQQEQARLKELENEQKTRNDNARTNRLCKRHGLLESIFPTIIDFTDEQYEKFVKQHITNKHGIAALANIAGQTVEAFTAANEEAKETKKRRKSAPAKATAKTVTADEKSDTTTTPAADMQPQNSSTPAPTVAGQTQNQVASNKTPNSTNIANSQGTKS